MCSPPKGFLPTVPLRPTRDSHFDSLMSCTPRSFLRNLVQLTLLCDAHCGAWLPSGKHIAERQSLTPWWDAHRRAGLHGCTPQSQASRCQVHQISCFFVFLCSLHLSTTFYKKTSEVKRFLKQFLSNSTIFILNIFRHKREIASVKLWIKTNTW